MRFRFAIFREIGVRRVEDERMQRLACRVDEALVIRQLREQPPECLMEEGSGANFFLLAPANALAINQ
jgi:hypothetical protein